MIGIWLYVNPFTSLSGSDGCSSAKHEVHKHIYTNTEIEAFYDLYHAVKVISDWWSLYLNLKVDSTTMNLLKFSMESAEVKKRECLQAFWNTGEATWEDVVKAVAEYPINNKWVAKTIIAQKYGIREEL